MTGPPPAPTAAGFCGHCGSPFGPTTGPFCGRCGVPHGGAAPPPPSFAYAYPAVAPSTVPHKLGLRRMLLVGGAVIGAVAIILTTVGVLARPTAAPACLASCGPPGAGTGPALAAQHTFSSGRDGWSLDYSDEFALSASDDHSVSFNVQECPFEVFSNPGGSADQVIQDALTRFPVSTFANVTKVFDVRGAQIGYQPGKGAIYDAQLNPAEGTSRHVRIVIITATRNGVTVVADGYCDDNPNFTLYELASGNGYAFDFPLTNFRWKGQS